MRNLDFSSWQGLLVTLSGLALVTLIGVGIRLLMMFTVQGRRERMNRQINERLRTLIAAYKVLGGSFTGDLTVDPRHLRDFRENPGSQSAPGKSERARRIRDAVEGALSDVLLLGTEEHVRLAEQAVRQLLAGQSIKTDALVVSLRNFIRAALDLDPIPKDLAIPVQGPARILSTGKSRGDGGKGDKDVGGKAGLGMGGGMSAGGGGLSGSFHDEPDEDHH
jgi:hypothetical protein